MAFSHPENLPTSIVGEIIIRDGVKSEIRKTIEQLIRERDFLPRAFSHLHDVDDGISKLCTKATEYFQADVSNWGSIMIKQLDTESLPFNAIRVSLIAGCTRYGSVIKKTLARQ